MTSSRRFGVLSIATVGGRQVSSQAAVITEAFEVVTLPFGFSELPICPDTRVGATGFWCVSRCSWVVALFCWCRGKGRLPIPTRGCSLLTLAFPLAGVTPQGISLELLECLGVVQ